MKKSVEKEDETLDTYVRKIGDQELKGLLLKLKNELRKPDVARDTITNLLSSIRRKDSEVFDDVTSLIKK
ncbi:MAG: hypothetical protein RIG61_05725 [Deltaproteobacteria bacterium]